MADLPSAKQSGRPRTPDKLTATLPHQQSVTPKTTTTIVDTPAVIQSGTPIAARISGSVPHSSTNMNRDAFYEVMREEISDKIVGPMKVEQFLDTFLPRPASMTGPTKIPSGTKMDTIRGAINEQEMYAPFVETFNRNLNTVKFLDCHSKSFPQLQGSEIKPDVVLSDDVSQKAQTLTLENVGIMVEMKHPEDADPFHDTKSTDKGKATLGQISAYAAAQMAAQFRTHVFSLLVFPLYARILRWDRAGVVVTEKVFFTQLEKPVPHLAEFFRRYDCSSPMERGIDPNVHKVSQSYVESLREDVKESLAGSLTDISFYRFTFPDPGSAHDENRHYVVATAQYMGTASVIGRSTRTFKAYCEELEDFVFLKDTWRVFDDSVIPEHETYAKLAEKKVQYVATAIDHHDMDGRETRTSEFRANKFGGGSDKFRVFRHYRLVLQEYATPLEKFENVKQLLSVFRQALQAHHEAFENAKILHRDISSGNIMIKKNGEGLLIDWDLSKPVGISGPRSPERTGTWQFLAYRLVKARHHNEPLPAHDKDDDLESFWYVLFWVALRRCEHSETDGSVSSVLRTLFDGMFLNDDGIAAALQAKLNAVRDSRTIADYAFRSAPLASILKNFQEVVRLRYMVTPEQIAYVGEVWKQLQVDNAGADSKALAKMLKRRLVDDFEDFPSEAYPSRKLEHSDWAQRLFDEILLDKQVNWETGGKNQERKGLHTRRQNSLKRKQGFTTAAEDEEEEQLRSKRSRLETMKSDLEGIPEHVE